MTSAVRAPRPTPRRNGPAAAPSRAAARRPELYVVGAPRRRAHTGAILTVATLVVFGSLLASAVLHSLLVSGQAHLDDLNTRIRVEQDQLQREQLRLASYQSPERIAREASRLGMVPADRQTWISPGTGAEPVVTGEGADPGPPEDPTTDPSADTPGPTSDPAVPDGKVSVR